MQKISIILEAIIIEIQLFDKVNYWTFLLKNSLCSLKVNYLGFLQPSCLICLQVVLIPLILYFYFPVKTVSFYEEFYNFVFKEKGVLF